MKKVITQFRAMLKEVVLFEKTLIKWFNFGYICEWFSCLKDLTKLVKRSINKINVERGKRVVHDDFYTSSP